MGFKYLEDFAVSDVAFEAREDSLEALFVTAAAATMNVMVDDLDAIEDRERRFIRLEDEAVDMLMFQFLQEFIFFKDAEELLLRASNVQIEKTEEGVRLSAEARGEFLDRERHYLNTDVKAVTMHRFRVEKTDGGWLAVVVLDV